MLKYKTFIKGTINVKNTIVRVKKKERPVHFCNMISRGQSRSNIGTIIDRYRSGKKKEPTERTRQDVSNFPKG